MPLSRAQPNVQWLLDESGAWFYYDSGRDRLVLFGTGRPFEDLQTFRGRCTSTQSGVGYHCEERNTPREDSGSEQKHDGSSGDSSESEEEAENESNDETRDTARRAEEYSVPNRPRIEAPRYDPARNMPALDQQMQQLRLSDSSSIPNVMYSLSSSPQLYPRPWLGQQSFVPSDTNVRPYYPTPRPSTPPDISVPSATAAKSAAADSSTPRYPSGPAVADDGGAEFSVEINGRTTNGKYDAAAEGNFVSATSIRSASLGRHLQPVKRKDSLRGPGGRPVEPKYSIDLRWWTGGKSYQKSCYVSEIPGFDLILGHQFIR
ncbi:hypothetical protein M409DRAFT_25133 [Zasmidium cellare ATCC 36951]|uniref:Uncharacterized protein n=1 Tax=Zasmidium cellare ATCC 36951 TaxID=1080233 RepID=A0A6A6CES2_ZASCE|nr:uncharacterized protein M409DRAFT_25133 [Zasmidium cellare ATCC 36951]KAF2164740.1 hypothetical protein M409DRAFT_25133 [Zasmidium cellare ATCC 36951]